jgi:hypothetical protein
MLEVAEQNEKLNAAANKNEIEWIEGNAFDLMKDLSKHCLPFPALTKTSWPSATQPTLSIAFRISADSKSPPESRSESAQTSMPSASSACRNSRTMPSSFEEWEMKIVICRTE